MKLYKYDACTYIKKEDLRNFNEEKKIHKTYSSSKQTLQIKTYRGSEIIVLIA